MTIETEWDETLWVEREEDMYALNSKKRVRVVRREEWLRSGVISSRNSL